MPLSAHSSPEFRACLPFFLSSSLPFSLLSFPSDSFSFSTSFPYLVMSRVHPHNNLPEPSYYFNNVYDRITNLFFFFLTDSLPSIFAAKSLQLCLTARPQDGSPPGFSVHGILQARTLEWVAISFSNAWKWKVKVKSLSCVWLLATPRTAAYQAPLSMGFSRQQYWSGVPLPSPIYL